MEKQNIIVLHPSGLGGKDKVTERLETVAYKDKSTVRGEPVEPQQHLKSSLPFERLRSNELLNDLEVSQIETGYLQRRL